MEVSVDDEAKLTLNGLQQHYVKIKENEKNKKLFELLDALEFNQVCVEVTYTHTHIHTHTHMYIYIPNLTAHPHIHIYTYLT